MIYAVIRYTPIIARVFEEKPLFFPLRLTPESGWRGRPVHDRRQHSPSKEPITGPELARRAGVIVFCHE